MRPMLSSHLIAAQKGLSFGLLALLAATALAATKKPTFPANTPVRGLAPASSAQRLQTEELYGNLPLRFEPNQGQAAKDVRFSARGPGYLMMLGESGASIVLRNGSRESLVRLRFDGASIPSKANPSEPLPGFSNYFLGSDTSLWRTHVPGYARVTYRSVYPGVDLLYYGNQRRLEYDFAVQPGADPDRIRLSFDGVTAIRLDPAGDLLLETPAGVLRQHKPRVYQERNGRQAERTAAYRINPDRSVTFALGSYDRNLPLIIDPVLAYSTFLGGVGLDAVTAIAVDSTGAAYLTGNTISSNFPTASAIQGTAGGNSDVFVTKLSPAGNTLVYSTYLGGSGDESGLGIAIDTVGSPYVAGYTSSTNFPTASAFATASAGGVDSFVAKLATTGDALAYSTYFGGSADDRATSIAVDGSGNAYVAGVTTSNNLPPVNALLGSYRGGPRDGFAVRFNSGTTIAYSTYLGGNGDDSATGIAVDSTGAAYITGYTTSTDFPMASAIYNAPRGGIDAFITKLTPAGNSAAYSTYLGGTSDDRGSAIAIDSLGAAYVGGWTFSSDFPKVSAFRSTFSGFYESFVTKINPTGSALDYSTFLGGDGEDFISSIAVDSDKSAIVAGYTSSTNFPTSATSAAYYNGRPQGAFVTRFSAAGNTVNFSTYLGGNADDQANGVAVDAGKNIYVAGTTQAVDFPVVSAFRASIQGSFDGFVSKFGDGTPVTFSVTTNPAGLNVTVDGSTAPSPRFFGWTIGSQHTIAAPSPQGSGQTRYSFTSWSDAGAASHTITAPATDATYTATYATQHLLTTSASPAGAGTVSATPASVDGFYTAGTSVSVSVSAAAGYAFAGFNGDLTGTAVPQSLTMSAPRIVTATFTCVYSLSATGASFDGAASSGSVTVTTGATCPFTASSNADWLTIVSGGSGNGSRAVNYQVAGNPNTTQRIGAITIAAAGTSLTFTVTQGAQPPASVTFTTVPTGRQVVVDGNTVTTPISFQFAPASTHSISVVSPQITAGTRVTFANWSDGGAQTHQITIPASGTLALVANFTVAYQLTTIINPNGTGAITTLPASMDGFFAAGTQIQVTAAPVITATFTGFSGALNGSTNPQALTMDGPKTVTATFSPLVCGSNYSLSPQTLVSEPAGGTFTVNVTAVAGCFWNASLSTSFLNPFLSLNAPTSGAGNGTVSFVVQANTTNLPRTASINVQGQLIQVLQKGTDVTQYFTDVPPAHLFFDYITLLKVHGTSNGCTATTYCPDDVTTRGKMAELVIKSKLGDDFPFQSAPYFTDVPASSPIFKYVQKMKELGITDGCTATTYCPNDPVTRGQMAVFLIRGKLNITSPNDFTYNATPYFTDAPVSNIFFPFIQKMKDLGVTGGCTATTYCVNDPNTLGQIAVFLIRSFNTP